MLHVRWSWAEGDGLCVETQSPRWDVEQHLKWKRGADETAIGWAEAALTAARIAARLSIVSGSPVDFVEICASQGVQGERL
jgi:hypothetical protein